MRDILQAQRSMDALLLNLVRPEVPAELAAMVAKMMAKEPELRFQTPNEVAAALAPFYKKQALDPAVREPGPNRTMCSTPAWPRPCRALGARNGSWDVVEPDRFQGDRRR